MFEEFAKFLNEQWEEVAAQEAKGKDLKETITWKVENMELRAIYTEADLANISYLQTFHQTLLNPDAPQRTWRNAQKIIVSTEKYANALALEALNGGVNEIIFEVSQIEKLDIEILLAEILLPYCAVSFVCKENQATQLLDGYLSYAKKYNYDVSALVGSIAFSDVSVPNIEVLRNLFALTQSAPNFLVINLLSTETHITDRYANLLLKATHVIDSLLREDFTIAQIAQKIQFTIGLSNAYFLEIAGLRVLRMLFTEIVKEYGLEDYKPYQVLLQANTTISTDEKTIQEPDWNMLSNTTQAMSAIIGGCDVLCVIPHNEGIGEVNSFSHRIARNVHNLLAEESYFDKVIDAGAGAYYIDVLTDKLAEKVWEQFTAQQAL
ncbi:methylmalonyl-CoA mutase family protein [Thermoflexibacter ruber]|uniref:Methylmalonyl-CoA mutase n=1 Tax=Thermoflexibacter ruber TaxID=1003 RepID=A0A1I2ATZ4_9BACT|nr:methylmalonyl-CoA mutase family protein [Thermoflexibacter ruber]SFE47454.1 methylmalonyl-CoA mutase [Thermoflexibacter ruber]